MLHANDVFPGFYIPEPEPLKRGASTILIKAVRLIVELRLLLRSQVEEVGPVHIYRSVAGNQTVQSWMERPPPRPATSQSGWWGLEAETPHQRRLLVVFLFTFVLLLPLCRQRASTTKAVVLVSSNPCKGYRDASSSTYLTPPRGLPTEDFNLENKQIISRRRVSFSSKAQCYRLNLISTLNSVGLTNHKHSRSHSWSVVRLIYTIVSHDNQ